MDSIHKEVAIREWAAFARDVVPVLRRSPGSVGSRDLNTVVERVLAAFDMFVLHDQHGDIDEVGPGVPCLITAKSSFTLGCTAFLVWIILTPV